MKRTVLLVGLVATLCATSALAAGDKFNRINLGKNWVVPSGSLYIVNNQLQGASLSLGYDKNSSSDTSVSALVYLTSTDVEYGAVASGNIAGGGNAFVKIQQQDGGGTFDHGAFYAGNNSGSDFFTLKRPVSSPATLLVTFCGTVATMKIKSAGRTQTYSYDYGTTFGTGGGLGTYGAVALDNYKSAPGGCAFTERGIRIKKGASHVRDLSVSK